MYYCDIRPLICTMSVMYFDPDLWDVPMRTCIFHLSLSLLCTALCTLRGLDIYAIYFSPYYSPCGHIHFRCYSFSLFIYSELYIVHVLTCHWLRQLNKPMANGWYMASLTLQDLYPVLQLVYKFWGRYIFPPKFLERILERISYFAYK